MSAPFMPFYVADYLGDTRHLTTEQHGAYLLLLMTMWRSGGVLPKDDEKLARITGLTVSRWRKISPDLIELFTVCEGGITQARLAAELAISEEKSEKRSQSGKAGARAKALKNNKEALANASRSLKHSPEPEPEPKESPLPPKGEKKARRKAATPIPDGFPDLEALKIARDMVLEAGVAVHVRTEADRIRDWAIGKDERKADWLAAWRNWIRSAIGRAPAMGLVQAQLGVGEEHDPWPYRIRSWVNDEGWNDVDWGPEPGEPGCRVPVHHLAGAVRRLV